MYVLVEVLYFYVLLKFLAYTFHLRGVHVSDFNSTKTFNLSKNCFLKGIYYCICHEIILFQKVERMLHFLRFQFGTIFIILNRILTTIFQCSDIFFALFKKQKAYYKNFYAYLTQVPEYVCLKLHIKNKGKSAFKFSSYVNTLKKLYILYITYAHAQFIKL